MVGFAIAEGRSTQARQVHDRKYAVRAFDLNLDDFAAPECVHVSTIRRPGKRIDFATLYHCFGIGIWRDNPKPKAFRPVSIPNGSDSCAIGREDWSRKHEADGVVAYDGRLLVR